jgi:single-strand DNA-binding protein
MQKGSLNKVLLIGHLGSDPESRFTTSGNAVTNFNLATNESWQASDGNTKDRTEWHRIVLFGKMAETAAEYMKKGQLVYIEGRLQTRSWEDKDKIKRYTTEVLCDNFTMLGPKREGRDSEQSEPDVSDDDLPF